MPDTETCARVGAALGIHLRDMIEDFEASRKHPFPFEGILRDDMNWVEAAYEKLLPCISGPFKQDFSRDMEEFFVHPDGKKAQDAMNLLRYPI